MPNYIRVEPSKCIGCKQCELACSFKHTGEFSRERSRILNEVFHDEASFITVTCLQCDDPWCVRSCPAGAIEKDNETQVVKVSEERCVGCRTCVTACPFGMIKYAPWKGKADKCDHCGADEPECMIFCPTGCITYSDEDTPLRAKVRTFARLVRDGRLEG